MQESQVKTEEVNIQGLIQKEEAKGAIRNKSSRGKRCKHRWMLPRIVWGSSVAS
jgi:hypothetical protein